jgi:hypothetical protein
VVVTSVLQTTAGKMIFGRFLDQSQSMAAPAGAVVPASTPRPQIPPSAAAAGK